MSANNKTSTIGLNQWQGNEYPLRTDFNEDNSIIDTQIKDLNTRINDLESATDQDVLESVKNVDGAGSGLDADLLDGLNGEEYFRHYADYRFGTGLDADDLKTQGFFHLSSDTLNLPVNYYGYMWVWKHMDIWVIQRFRPSSIDNIYERRCEAGVWQPWSQIWTSTTDGSGSGLDADTLDGKNASDFAPDGYGLGTTCVNISSQDLNNYDVTGFFMGANVINAPTPDWYYYEIMKHNNIWCLQIATRLHTNERWMRRKNDDVWQSWIRILTEETGYSKIKGGRNAHTFNTPAMNALSYSQGHIELRTDDGSCPILGFHRGGYTAGALYHQSDADYERLKFMRHDGADYYLWDSGLLRLNNGMLEYNDTGRWKTVGSVATPDKIVVGQENTASANYTIAHSYNGSGILNSITQSTYDFVGEGRSRAKLVVDGITIFNDIVGADAYNAGDQGYGTSIQILTTPIRFSNNITIYHRAENEICEFMTTWNYIKD